MISIRKTISDLDEYRQQRDLAFDCYLAAIRNTAHYAIELDDGITAPHRKYLTALAEEVTGATPASLEESRGTFRGLLRDYRDKASHYLAELREQLAGTTRALQQIVESLVHSDGDHEIRMRSALATLRRVVESPEAHPCVRCWVPPLIAFSKVWSKPGRSMRSQLPSSRWKFACCTGESTPWKALLA